VLTERIEFHPEADAEIFSTLGTAPAVFLLRGADANSEPYVSKTANLRRRLQRLLSAPEERTKRLNLRDRVRSIEYTLTGSDFESGLVLYQTLRSVFPQTYADRLRFRFAPLVKLHLENEFPRASITTRLGRLSGKNIYYGPFPSRTVAEKFMNDALDFFKMRRCVDDLHPDPTFPGCVYSEMKMCLAPCYKGCTDQRYAEESNAVESFLATRGESRLVTIRTQRDQASANLEFESAASLHAQVQRVESIRALAPELVRPLSQLRAVILQPSAHPDEVSLFIFENGRLNGPAAYSTLGMRIQNEASGSSSLFAQPMAIEPVPEMPPETTLPEASTDSAAPTPAKLPRSLLESRLDAVLASLALTTDPPSSTCRQGHLALLKRWYYRPETRRSGEIFFPDAEGRWPSKSILRSIGRVAAGRLKATTPTP
jgi:excinuclease UvrABC nuclease subunit